ncbi:hypothetical protein LOAG_16660 [Loa loa]|uniref:Uncharacterized protein n=2 Tax=Loa loa TaxID=7209 RepID=A0A1S0UKW0_LOALO|nr:hypothetical protein LOAG_16660 [Loa loa]EJD76362.1 hypothetical protein LOAG_16660 [Loa loa]
MTSFTVQLDLILILTLATQPFPMSANEPSINIQLSQRVLTRTQGSSDRSIIPQPREQLATSILTRIRLQNIVGEKCNRYRRTNGVMMRSNKGIYPTTTKSTRVQVKPTANSGVDEDRERVEAAIFFLRCQEWMTRKYIEEIRILYLNPLDELCNGMKRTVESVSKSMEPSSGSSAQGAIATNKRNGAEENRVVSMDKVAEKLQQALKALQRDDGEIIQGYRSVTREKTVSLADCCALYRLKTILKAMQKLLDIQTSLDKWFENNKDDMTTHKGLLKNLLTNALTNFEMAYIITELFDIQQVPLKEIQKTKPKYCKYIRSDIGTRDIATINKPLNKGVTTKDYIKKLEGQISHFRTVVYEIAKNLEIIIETIIANVRDHHLEVNIKQIAIIIDNLPPRYRFPETIHLSPFAKKLLVNAPPSPDNGGDVFGSSLDNLLSGSSNSKLSTQPSQTSKSHSSNQI